MCKEKPEFQNDEGLPLIKAVKETIKSKSFLLYMGYIFCNAFNGSIGLSYLFVYMLILGEKEVKSQKVSLRKRREGDRGEYSINEFIDIILNEIKTKGLVK